MKKIKPIYIYGAILIAAIFLFKPATKYVTTIQGGWDISDEVAAKGYDIYLVEEADFDYSDQEVYDLAKSIKQNTDTPEEAVKETIRWVVKNIAYSSAITVDYCYNEKASTVLDKGYGDCVSMSRIVVALLRAQGIPARTMGGCLSQSVRCSAVFAVVPFMEIPTTELVEGDFKKRGFLHEWVEFYIPSTGWQRIESTSGQAYPINDCGQYMNYNYDDDKYSRCVINEVSFFETCRVF